MLFKPFPIFGKQANPPPFPGVTGSLRRATRMQFSGLTGIVGTRIDRALADFFTRFNALQPDDLDRRSVTRQFVGGFSPMYGGLYQDPMPFLRIANTAADTLLTGSTANPTGILNTYRLKGTFNDCAESFLQYAWTNTLYFPRPVRIVGIHLNMLSLPGYNYPANLYGYRNPWQYGHLPPDPRAQGDWLNDMYLDAAIDSKWYKGNSRRLTESELQKATFTAQNQLFSRPLAAPIADEMAPPYPEDPTYFTPFGVCIDIRNVEIAIPEQSTFRLSVLFPDYNGNIDGTYGSAKTTGWNSGLDDAGAFMPWGNQVWSWTVTVAEGLA